MEAIVLESHLDGLVGPHIVGWAFNNNGKDCKITVTDEHGKVLASGLANIDRPDLSVLGWGRCNFAFRIPLPSGAGELLHVLADGVEVPNSPLRLGASIFDGYFSVIGDHVEGWVAERRSDFPAPLITVRDQYGQIVYESLSNIRAIEGDDNLIASYFSGQIADFAFGCSELLLTAFANGVQFAQTSVSLPLSGNAETISSERCSGWLVSPAAPNRALSIDIFRDGELATTAKCVIVREDVKALIGGAGRAGFEALLPVRSGPLQGSTAISFRLHGSDKELFDGPHILGSRAELVSAARHLSRLALSRSEGNLSALERAVISSAMAEFISRTRGTTHAVFGKQATEFARQPPVSAAQACRFNIIIPIYRGVDITQDCIESVLAHRDKHQDYIILINDKSPDEDMDEMLRSYSLERNLFLLNNETNLGFVKSVNKGIAFCTHGDIVLLNSDTQVFSGGLEELWRVAHSSPDIGTATAMSNNASIFSYPHANLRRPTLDDIGWSEVAALALEKNKGKAVDAPTGHGFCMLVKEEVIRRVGNLDEGFGRGYGEENDLCARGADLGYRNVFAPGAFVVHHENISFAEEKSGLLSLNIAKLEKRYPEYTAIIMEAERRDDFRSARWALDAERLRRASEAGNFYTLIVHNKLGGGTANAISEIEEVAGYGGSQKISLIGRQDGYLEFRAEEPAIQAQFSSDEIQPLIELLSAADIKMCIVHQVLGFPPLFLTTFGNWLRGKHSVLYAHDFYSACPRVTMIDALGQFCGLASADVCARCVSIGGAHETSRMQKLTPADHRALFHEFLRKFDHVIAPSKSAVHYLKLAFPDIEVEAIPHPELSTTYPPTARPGDDNEIVLFGAIGPHKGSAKLLEIAQLARLHHPLLHFHVIGSTDRDEELLRLGNVTITGPYSADDLPGMISGAKGRLALFLSGWPETYSYTLSEAVRHGFIPLVPDIGAFSERVKTAGFGVIFPFPISSAEVLNTICGIASGAIGYSSGGVGPQSFKPDSNSANRTRQLLSEYYRYEKPSPPRRSPTLRPNRSRKMRASTSAGS